MERAWERRWPPADAAWWSRVLVVVRPVVRSVVCAQLSYAVRRCVCGSEIDRRKPDARI
jgi:hypothetical protein